MVQLYSTTATSDEYTVYPRLSVPQLSEPRLSEHQTWVIFLFQTDVRLTTVS